MKKIIFAAFITTIALIIQGYTVTLLWSWFIVPIGISIISLSHSIGLILLLKVFKNKGDLFDNIIDDIKSSNAKTEEETIEEYYDELFKIFLSLITYLMIVFFAWIVHMFM